MADNETVSYRAKSVFASKTMWVNLVAALVAFLGGDSFKALLGPYWPEWLTGLLALVNMALRYVTTRPVSVLVAPGESKPVPVEKLK